MTLGQTRIVFRLLFLLPIGVLGLALLGIGLSRLVAELSGRITPDGTLSGFGTLMVSLLPLGAFGLIFWLVVRRPQKLPRPEPDALAPESSVGIWRHAEDLEIEGLRDSADRLGLEIEGRSPSAALSLVRKDRWRFGYLVALIVVLIATWVAPPTIENGGLALTPINAGLAVFGTWLGLYLLLLTLPISTRRIEFRPEHNALVLSDGRRSRRFGLSRLKFLEVRLRSESTRDSEIQQARATRHHPALIGWFEVEDRGLCPFRLIDGPREKDRNRAENHRKDLQLIAERIARSFGVETGLPPKADQESVPYE